MNIHAIKEGLTILRNAIEMLESAKNKLPAGKKRDEIEHLMGTAEEKIIEAEARVGHELGFPICKRCWPPVIMVHNDEGEFICKGCGKSMPPGTTAEIPNFDDLATW